MNSNTLSEEFRRIQKLAGLITESMFSNPNIYKDTKKFIDYIPNYINEDKIYISHEYILPLTISGGKIYIQKDILPKYPEVKVDRANSIINKTDNENKTYYLVTNPNKVDIGSPSDSLFKASSVRGLTPDEKIEQQRKREKQISYFKDELEKLGNPSKSELRKSHYNLWQSIWRADLIDDLFPELSAEEKREKLIQKLIPKFKAELEKLGNPTKSELYKNYKGTLYDRIRVAGLLDDLFPELTPEEERKVLISKFKDELEKLGNPTKSELYKNYKGTLYKRIWTAGLLDYFYPELSPEEKREKLIQKLIPKFKDELEKLGNPTKSELYKNYKSTLYKRIRVAGLLKYFFPDNKEDIKKESLSEDFRRMQKLAGLTTETKYPKDTKEFIKYIRDYIEDNDIKTPGELRKKNSTLYQLISTRGLGILFRSKEFFTGKLRTKENETYPIDNQAFIRFTIDYIKDNDIKTPGELRKKNSTLYHYMVKRKLTDEVYAIVFPEYSRQKFPKDDKEFIDYVVNYIKDNDIETPGELHKKNSTLYTTMSQRKLTDQVLTTAFPDYSRQKLPKFKDDKEFIDYVVNYIRDNDIKTPNEFKEKNAYLYITMSKRKLADKVYTTTFPELKRKPFKENMNEQFRRMQKLAGVGNNQILVEKNELANTLKSTIDNFDPNLSYKELAMAVADILREEYGEHLYKAFIKELQDKLLGNGKIN